MKKKPPQLLAKYSHNGPFSQWVEDNMNWYKAVSLFLAFALWWACSLHYFWLIGFTVVLLNNGIAGLLMLATASTKIRLAELAYQKDNPKDVGFELYEAQYKLDEFDLPKAARDEHVHGEPYADVVMMYAKLFGSVYIDQTNNVQIRNDALTKLKACYDLIHTNTQLDLVKWIACVPGEDFSDHIDGDIITVISSWTCVNTQTGEIAEFDLIPGWHDGIIKSGAEMVTEANGREYFSLDSTAIYTDHETLEESEIVLLTIFVKR